jgi:hypothetical protein
MCLEHDPARQKLRGRTHQAREPPGDLDAMSIKVFCRRHSISEPFYHKLQQRGEGPDVIKAGGRTLITPEAARAWRERFTKPTNPVLPSQETANPQSSAGE